MVVRVAPLVTVRKPLTHLTVLDWFRIGDRFSCQGRLKFASHFAEVSEVTLHLKLFHLRSSAEGDMHPPGLDTLDPRQQVGIKAELKYRARFGRLRQFGLHDFVGPWA